MAGWARDVDVGKLMGEMDFRDYLNALNWLFNDP